jgi:hypothetical protein
VVVAQRAESLDVDIEDLQAAAGEVVESALGVDRVVEDDRVDDQAERAELLLLAERVAALAAVANCASATAKAAVAVTDVAASGGAS